MADLGMDFNAEDVEPSAPREIIPAGKYIAQIVESEMKATSNGEGQFLSLQYEIIDGPHTGRRLFNNLNLVNANATAVEIAHRDLSAICHATGTIRVSNSDQLHFKPMIVTVKVRPAGPDKKGVQREAQNEVGGHEATGNAPPRQQATQTARPAPAQTARPAAATASVPAAKAAPWARARTAAW